MDAIDQFRTAMVARQIVPPAEILADGKIHRCDAEGKNGRGDAAYLLHLDGIPAGGLENHRDGRGWENWRADVGRKPTAAEENALKSRVDAQRAERAEQEAARLAETKSRATAIWEASTSHVGGHPYLTAKRIGSHKTRLMNEPLTIAGMDCAEGLVIPMRDSTGAICQLQVISPTGEKRYLPGPKPGGLYFSIGKPSGVVCVAEGFATAASIHEATGHAVAVAFDCGNLAQVAKAIRKKLPSTKIILCADDDCGSDGNPGITNATSAARMVGGYLAVPDFGTDRPTGATDFNDLVQIRGSEAIKRSIEAAALVDPVASVVADKPMAGLVCAAGITPEPINWLWQGWLAAGKLHILAGSPGAGKTTVALAFAATISCGGRWPDGTKAEQGHVLIWSSEDDAKDTLVPRLIAMGADLTRVHLVQTANDGEGTRSFDPAKDIQQLRNAIRQLGISPKLLIVDPIVSAVAGDSHKASDTRRSLQQLVDLGIAEDCAIFGISHFSKGTAGRDVLERVTGSLAFGALARLVYVVAKMPEDQGGSRVIARAKSNVGPDGGGFRYELRQQVLPTHSDILASTLVWREAIDGNARDILAQAEVTEDADTKAQIDETQEWLRDLLMSGPVKAAEVEKKAKAAGLTKKSLRSARERLGVRTRKQDYSGGWVWALPKAPNAQYSQGAQDAQPQSLGALGIFDGNGPTPEENGDTDAELF